MPVYVCRWPNGDCSFVSAPTKESAIERLDEIDNAEGCPIRRVERFQIHFKLTDDGRLELDEEGIWTWNSVSVEPDICDIAYPLLRDVLFQIFDETDNAPFTPEQQERIREAVRLERARVEAKTVLAPDTEVGKRIKSELDMPTTLVNRAVREEATRQLKAFKRKGKAH
ncbi:MAG: hypothetical protein ACREUZ_04020 [Burkholderiales bacterium]